MRANLSVLRLCVAQDAVDAHLAHLVGVDDRLAVVVVVEERLAEVARTALCEANRVCDGLAARVLERTEVFALKAVRGGKVLAARLGKDSFLALAHCRARDTTAELTFDILTVRLAVGVVTAKPLVNEIGADF